MRSDGEFLFLHEDDDRKHKFKLFKTNLVTKDEHGKHKNMEWSAQWKKATNTYGNIFQKNILFLLKNKRCNCDQLLLWKVATSK